MFLAQIVTEIHWFHCYELIFLQSIVIKEIPKVQILFISRYGKIHGFIK